MVMIRDRLDLQKVMTKFISHFKVRNSFCDMPMTLLTGNFCLDVPAFDKWLREEHGYDGGVHGSFEEFITMKFGMDAYNFILELFECEK